MKAIPVSLALAAMLSAGPAYADSIDPAASGEAGTIADLSARGIDVCPDLRRADLRYWDFRRGAPMSLTTMSDQDDSDVRHGSLLERSFLAGGGTAFGTYRSHHTIRSIRAAFRAWKKNRGRDRSPGSGPLATPEPGALLLVGTGLLAVARQARKRRNAA